MNGIKSHVYAIQGDRVRCLGGCPAAEPHWAGHGPVSYTMVNGTKMLVVRVGKVERDDS